MLRKNLSCLELYRKTLVSNTGCLIEYIQKLIYLYERKQEVLSVVLLDVDNMKQINKKMGYAYGNHVLLKISEVIEASIRRSDVAGKYKGSSFLILLPNSDLKGAEKVSRRIRNKIESLQSLLDVSLTIGIYSFVPEGDRVEDVLDLLERYVANSKMKGGNSTIVIEEKPSKREINHQALLEALQKDAIEPAFQPIYSLSNDKVEGYEVLMRLVKEDGTIIPAGCFIEDLSKTSLIGPFEELVLQKALSKFSAYRMDGKLYINFPHNFINFIAKGKIKVLDFYKDVISHGINPSRVVLEISEGKITANTEDLLELIREIKGYGFWTAVDDFGVEYSSIERLIRARPDLVKLDGFFLKERSILKWIVMGLKKLGFKLIVEQVETREELELVKSLRVDMAQGYYLGRPEII
ncbi:MAG: bifunctional diguanylate cyclase/phosphodiesterase [Aquificaceae bacterium]|nr:bifunctional diguanylate cyclase/phosphodiesterase [Aquificaceae bacterium]